MNRKKNPAPIKELLKEMKVGDLDLLSFTHSINLGKAFYLLEEWASLDHPARCFGADKICGIWQVRLWTSRVQKMKPILEQSENLETAVKEALKRFGG